MIYIIFLAILACAFLIYSVLIEPASLKDEHITLAVKKSLDSPITVALISDVHIGKRLSLDRFEQILTHVNSHEPDFIVIAGDLLDNARKFKDHERLTRILGKCTPKIATYAILGNHERAHDGVQKLINSYQKSGVKLLINQADEARQDIHIFGSDCAMFGHRSSDYILDGPSQTLNLLLLHQPDAVEDYFDKDIDIVLSGHTHGGQVNLFGIRPILPDLAQKYIIGKYTHRGKYGVIEHYISRGIGTSHLPIRFLSQPELTIIQITKSHFNDHEKG